MSLALNYNPPKIINIHINHYPAIVVPTETTTTAPPTATASPAAAAGRILN